MNVFSVASSLNGYEHTSSFVNLHCKELHAGAPYSVPSAVIHSDVSDDADRLTKTVLDPEDLARSQLVRAFDTHAADRNVLRHHLETHAGMTGIGAGYGHASRQPLYRPSGDG